MFLIIGYGNTLRRDDGLGPLAAKRLAVAWRMLSAEVACLTAHQLTPELALEVADPEVQAVVFVDAAVNVPTIVWARLPSEGASPLGHTLSPQAVMMYAEKLYRRSPSAWLLSLPVADLGHGEGLSPTAQAALASVARQAAAWLETLSEPLAIR